LIPTPPVHVWIGGTELTSDHQIMKTPIHERLNAILNDPSASYWLKDSLRSALRRDIVDAANDAEVLAEVLADRCEDLTGEAKRQYNTTMPFGWGSTDL